MIQLIETALFAAPVCAFACGGILDFGPDAGGSDATTQTDRTVASNDPPSDDPPTTTVEAGGPDSASVPDSGVVDAGCQPEIIIKNGCQDLNRGWWIRTCGDHCSKTLCADYYKQCPCSAGYERCEQADADVVHCFCGVSGGRWTAGIEQRALADDTLGGFFAWMVWGESASIHSFTILERELAAHGAPKRLLAAARRARRDEIRHTRIGQRLALRHGVTAEVAKAPVSAAVRMLEEIAIENAVEACVSETWSAVLTRAQVSRARDPMIRRVFARIADDEARHATLAWNVAKWAKGKLPPDACERVDSCMRTALRRLRDGIVEPGEAQREVGIPSRAEQLAMMSALERTLWA